jgi:amino acid permease
VTVSVVFYIPLNTHPCRITIDWMITTLSKELAKVDVTVRYVIETIIMDALALLIAIAIPNVVVVFGLLGATATALCCYVMPGLLYIKAANLRWLSKEALLPLCLVTSGTVCGIVSTVVIIFDMIENPSQLE